MSVFNGVFPILPGKADAARAFANEVVGARKSDFAAMHKRTGVTRETWSLQETPGGSLLLVWFEGDPNVVFTDLATGTDPFMVWFREEVKNVSGVDLAAPAAGGPQLLFEWRA